MDRQTITVDISPGKDPIKRLCVTQGDVGRPLGVYIKQNGTALDCSDYTVDLYVLKPDGNYYSVAAEVDSDENNLVTWDTAEQETILAGDCPAQIRISDSSVDIGTAEFIEYVEKSPMAMGVESETILSNVQITSEMLIMPSGVAPGATTSLSTSISKPGYYPVGIVGARFSEKTIGVTGARVTGRSSGQVDFSVTLCNLGSSSTSPMAMYIGYIDILWLKE